MSKVRLIDADALKKHIAEIFETEEKIDKKWAMGLKYSLKIIDKAPTVAEDYDTSYQDGLEDGLNDIRPQGAWVGDTDYESCQGHYESYKCSNCGHGLHWRDYYADKYNFCPNCGAEMSGDKE